MQLDGFIKPRLKFFQLDSERWIRMEYQTHRVIICQKCYLFWKGWKAHLFGISFHLFYIHLVEVFSFSSVGRRDALIEAGSVTSPWTFCVSVALEAPPIQPDNNDQKRGIITLGLIHYFSISLLPVPPGRNASTISIGS